jgi:hypothetical protein
VADGVMMSDVPLPRIEAAVAYAQRGLARREARRELALRGAMSRWYFEPFLSTEDAEFVENRRAAFFKAYWRRSHKIEGIREHIIQSLLDGLTISGTVADLDKKMNEFSTFRSAGVNELAFRIHDDPVDSIRIIGERVVPELA